MSPGGGFVLPVDKPEGPTSHDVVAEVRRALGERRIGHTGTLDPFASGLLVLCDGPATRVAEYLSGLDKTYEATARLGVRTDTLDREGRVLEERAGWQLLGEEPVVEALERLRGDILQQPPQFSAKKVRGVRMHERARRGEHVPLEPCSVTVHDIELTMLDPPFVSFRVRCSTGTYVRALARDLGEDLGVGAHLTELRRTAVGSLDVGRAVGPGQLADEAALARARIDPLEAMAHLPRVSVDEAGASRLAHGQRLRVGEAAAGGLVVVARGAELVAVAEIVDGLLCPRKVFAT